MIDKTVSHYHILEKIGGGGMGVVYKAEDTKLRRTVALKFLAPELTRDEDAKRRFVHEAQAASALDHPNICSIYDIDETPEGQLYIAMACYDGESVKERIARRRIEVREAFEIAYAVAQGLARAHASGIIHRDIKPGNIMITKDGFVKIVDFGLAKLIGRSRITGSGATLGTIAYMSPEQARSEDSDARADIWALGAVLYEMLTGKLPFRGEIDQAVVYAILNQDPEPVQNLREDMPDACAAVVTRCLEKNPARRYQTIADFTEALVDAADRAGWDTSFAAGTVRAVSMVRGGRSRRSWKYGLMAGVAALAVLATVAWKHFKNRSIYTTDIRLAVMPFERLGDAPSQAFVDGLSQWTAIAMESASRVTPSMWTMPYSRVVEDRPADLDRMDTTFGVNRVLNGTIQRFENSFRVSLSMIDANTLKPVGQEAVVFSLDQADELPRAVAKACASLLNREESNRVISAMAGAQLPSPAGFVHYLEGLGYKQRYGSVSSLDSAEVALSAAAREKDAPAAWIDALGHCYSLRWQKTRSPADQERAEGALRRAMAIDSTFVPSYVHLAKLLRSTERASEGPALLERAIAIDPLDVDAYHDLGSALAALQRYDEAEAAYRRCVRITPDYFGIHWRLGWLYRQMNRPEQEIAEHQLANRLAPDDFRTLNSLGLYYSDRGNWEPARRYFEQAYILHPDCASSSNVGSIMYYQGRFGDSARYYKYALEYGDSTQYWNWANLACALYWADGRRDDGIAKYRKAISLAEAQRARVPEDAATTARLADYYAMIGEDSLALTMIERSEGLNDMEVYYRLACAYASLGDDERAIEFIGKAVREHYPVHEVEKEPLFRGLVRDARLRSMLEIASKERSEQ